LEKNPYDGMTNKISNKESKVNYGQHKAILLLLILSATFIGCKSSKQSADAGATDAKAVAARILSQYEAGELSQIYKESAPTFKQTGPEARFVAQFQQSLKKTGKFNNQKEPGIESRPNDAFVITYHLENDRFNTDIHLTLAKSASGKFELVGIQEHDEPKK